MVDDEGKGSDATAIQRKRPSVAPSDDAATPRIERVTNPHERVTNQHERLGHPHEDAASLHERITHPIDRVTSPINRVANTSDIVTNPVDRVTTPLERVAKPVLRAPGTTRAESPIARVESPIERPVAPERAPTPFPLPAPEPTLDSLTTDDRESEPLPSRIDEPSTAAPVRARPANTSHHGGSTTIGSPLEALERDELLRTRRFCIIGAFIALAGAFSVPLLPGDPTASALLLSCVGGALASILFLYVRTSDPIAFRRPSTLLGWFIPAVCVTSVIPFFGVFSPAAVVLVLGIYFTGLGKSKGLAAAVYTVCAGMQGLLAILVITEVVYDTGIVAIMPIAKRDQWIVQGLVQVVLAGTYITARISRKTALAAVGELERAVRLAAHREALLLEAREELERALRSGRGRFSDQTLGGYQLGEVIGRGAMGEVYEATAPDGNAVAIKLLSQASLGNLNHVLRFLRELRTAANLVADNVVRVIEVGESPVPYLVMERLQGKTLAEMLRNQRALPANEVLDMVRQVGAGITAAAGAGIVHRDLKPQNVFLHQGRTWKVLDFGVARAMDAGDTLTAGHVVGTPSYMAPEQASGAAVDHLTDLYALAAITYRALTGHPPYAAGEIAETLYKVIHTSPRRPSELVEMPSDVDLVLAIGLAKRASDRFSNAADFADALQDAFRGDLPEELQERGAILVRAGAWAASKVRASTARLR